jgi:Na+-driven multidrug efflux pump
MVANLMGQNREDQVLPAIRKISWWSIGLCFFMVLVLNLFPSMFFKLFGQDEAFVQAGIPVIRIVSLGMLLMSLANIWLNGVTGTGKTKVNLLIEILAILLYLAYTWYFMRVHYISLAMAWSNEFIYWSTVFLLSFWFLNSGKWKTKLKQSL